MPRMTPAQAGGTNVCAFLDTIALSELGAAVLANPNTDDGYNVLVGCTPTRLLTFPSYATHPAIYNKALNSTAAGRYQLLSRYFAAYKAQLGLPDFGPVSQDAIAIQQIRECRAFDAVVAGEFVTAIGLVAHIWASFPGAGYHQHEQELTTLQSAYLSAGGQIASLANVTGSVA
jgi:muramidase (phage lysozyme)